MRGRGFSSSILAGYRDVQGVYHKTDPSVARALARVFGENERTTKSGAWDDVLVVRSGERVVVGAGELALEDGSFVSVAKKLPPDVPLGYHTMRLFRSGRSVRLIVSPGTCRAPDGRFLWGLSAQVYGLRSAGNWGFGDFRDIRDLARWSSTKLGAGLLLIDPVGAVAPTQPQETSPYRPTSRVFLNPLYLRIEEIRGARALAGSLARIARKTRQRGRGELIDRDEVFSAKLFALERLFRSFGGSAEFDRFCEREGEPLLDFATFCALSERYGGAFRNWPSEYQDSKDAAVGRFRRNASARIRFHQWVQWNLDEQLRRAGKVIPLVRDLPVGVDPDGADVWMSSETFARGASIGAPPDAFNREGQDWGLCAFLPERLRQAGYEPFIRAVRAAFRYGGGLRVDHIMGLFRLYLIPEGNEPKQGAYVRFPARELLDILALESHRAGAFVVGEDLGTVDAAHRRELRRRGVLSSRVAWFEKRSPAKYPRQSAASVSTHDLPTIAGVVTGRDLEDQEELGLRGKTDANARLRAELSVLSGLPPSAPLERIIEATYAALARAPSAVILVSLEDALAVPHRPNVPGVAGPPNFCRALPVSLERLSTSGLLRRIANVLDARSSTSGDSVSGPADDDAGPGCERFSPPGSRRTAISASGPCYGRAVARTPRRLRK